MDYTDQDFAAAAETCDRLGVQWDGLQKAAGILRTVGSLKGTIKALTKEIAELSKARDDERLHLERVKAEAKAAAAESEAYVEAAKQTAATLEAKARTDAEGIVQAASEQVALDLAHAKADQEAKLAGLKKTILDAEKKLRELEAKTVKANEAAASVEARAAEAHAKLEKVLAAAKSITA